MKPLTSRLSASVKSKATDMYFNQGVSKRKIAKQLGIAKSTLSDFFRTEEAVGTQTVAAVEPVGAAKILFFDVEVSASIVLAFPRWNVNVAKGGVLQEPYMLTYAGCWGDGKVFSAKLTDYDLFNIDHTNDYALVCELKELLDAADIVIAHNAKFDKGWVNQRLAYWGISPPSPYRVICTLTEVRKAFSLPSNSLASVTDYFELTKKLGHSGMDLWKRCMAGDREAFNEMEEYNIGDIPTLYQVYNTVLPFMKNHPNLSVYGDTDDISFRCGKCGSLSLVETESFSYTNSAKYRLYKCTHCGGHQSSKENLLSKDKRKSIGQPA